MRMNNRICKVGKTLLVAVCLLSTCGVTYSCSDDYDLPDTKPSFLGESIYDELVKQQRFSTAIKLIDDLDYKSVLSQTGSKTLFVADDDAYAHFFETTTWVDGYGNPVRSYDQLSLAQKRILLYGSMLDNAYVLEMLTTMQGPTKNMCLRQISSSSVTDTIPYWKWDELPNNQNKGQTDANGNVTNADPRFWDKYRTEAKGGIYMAIDDTDPLMTHFLQGQLNEQNITHEDVSFLLNIPEGSDRYWSNSSTENRSFVYDREIKEADNVCLNGYYHVLDSVLVTPSNMAEVIRSNGDTKLFSAMLDRFSAPYYDKELTDEYKALHDIAADSVFKKIYVSQRSSVGSVTTDPDGEALTISTLSFDPGWNAYNVSGLEKEEDMAAMFVPSDEAMRKYFIEGAGRMLIERYSGGVDNTAENLEYNLYQIPLNVIRPMIANLMKESFNETVPSKYLTIMNDAQDPMFSGSQYTSVSEYKQLFKKVMLANNGVVYIMNDVIGPATYSSVMAPALYSDETQVVNTVIHADDDFISSSSYTYAPLRKYYSTYLLAMQSNFTLFVPKDAGLKNYGYADVITSSYGTADARNRRLWTFEPEEISGTGSDAANYRIAVRANAYRFDQNAAFSPGKTGDEIAQSPATNTTNSGWGQTKKFLLTEMVDQHIIVHGNDDEDGVFADQQYYTSRGGAPVYIKERGNRSENGVGMKVDGGFQLMVNSDDYSENDFDCVVENGYDQTRETNEYGNGMTYFLDRPMQPTFCTVYNVLKNTPEFSEFYNLCESIRSNASALAEDLFKTDDMTTSEWNSELPKYNIFSERSSRPTAQNEYLIRFFNNYRYTVFVPSNTAMAVAYSKGLKTPTEIEQFIEDNTVDDVLDESAKVEAQAMYNTMLNFVKYHFCDNALYVDNVTEKTECMSACTSEETNGFIRLTVNQYENNGNPIMTVTDATGNTVSVTSDKSLQNLMARDYELDNSTISSARTVNSSSYVAIHSLGDNYLMFADEIKDNFTKAWQSPAKARAFVKKYRIRK